MPKFVASTMSSPVTYTRYSDGDMPRIIDSVTIMGNTGVADRRTLVTLMGASVTEVSDEHAELLKNNPVFKRHAARGFIGFVDARTDGEAAAAEMESRDAGAPDRPEDYEAQGQKPPTTSVEATAPALPAIPVARRR